GGLEVVGNSPITDRFAVEQDVAGARVHVARLADRADVAQRLSIVQAVNVIEFLRTVELVEVFGELLGKDAGNVRVTLKKVALNQGENALHLALIVDVLGKDVFIERIAGRTVDEEQPVLAMAARSLVEEFPAALLGVLVVHGVFELAARPENGPL